MAADIDTETPMTLEQMQHWTRVVGRAQQLVLERAAQMLAQGPAAAAGGRASPMERIADIQTETASKGMAIWQDMAANLGKAGGAMWSQGAEGYAVGDAAAAGAVPAAAGGRRDARFADAQWHDHPVYSLLRQTYLLAAEAMLRTIDSLDGVDERQREQMRFAAHSLIDASSPSNHPLTNPEVVRRTLETGGSNLLTGIERMLADIDKGQLSQTDTSAFEVGRNVAVTPGKVIAETPLFEIIQYAPQTETVHETPLVIFPPWINRFYILDLSPEKSFVRWAVEQGITVCMVSWKSADASMADVSWDDYVVRGQVAAIDIVRERLNVESVHAIGYCVAGTTLAAALAWLEAKGRQDIVRSATYFTAQVDFADAGELGLFVDSQQIEMIERLVTDGYLDGRYLAATFNLLRGKDLIWSYVVNNYLMADAYAPFDLLFWNGDTTNLPGKWLRSYLEDLYRDNRLVEPGALSIDGEPIDLRRVSVPAYIQAGVEDHIAPARSVWKAMHHLGGEKRFVLAGSGHIAGVVNPPAKTKYQYWTCEGDMASLEAFKAAATETKGSWWPDWLAWLTRHDGSRVPPTGARQPDATLADAPGRYVRMR